MSHRTRQDLSFLHGCHWQRGEELLMVKMVKVWGRDGWCNCAPLGIYCDTLMKATWPATIRLLLYVPAPEGMIYPPLRLKRGDECAAPWRYDGGGLLYGVIFKLQLLITQVPSEARVKEFCVWWTRRRGTKNPQKLVVWDAACPISSGLAVPGAESLFPFCHSSTLYGSVSRRGGLSYTCAINTEECARQVIGCVGDGGVICPLRDSGGQRWRREVTSPSGRLFIWLVWE